MTSIFLSEHLLTARFQDLERRESVGLAVDLDQKLIPGSKIKKEVTWKRGPGLESFLMNSVPVGLAADLGLGVTELHLGHRAQLDQLVHL